VHSHMVTSEYRRVNEFDREDESEGKKVKNEDLRGWAARKLEGFIGYSYCIPKT
jgi:hypothetical protein